MSEYVEATDVLLESVESDSGESLHETGPAGPPPSRAIGRRLAELRRTRGMTQRQVAERMGVTKGRISQIERGKVSGQDVIARYAVAIGGRLSQAIYFEDGYNSAIA